MIALIFDLDGTLIDTEKYYRRCWPAACKHFGYDMTDAQALSLRSLGRPFAPQFLKDMFHKPDFDYATIREYRKVLFQKCVDEEGVQFKKGAEDLFSYLDQKQEEIKVAIATATDITRAKEYLGLAGGEFANRLMEHLVSAADMPYGKPEPDVYQFAVKELGMQPEKCIAVEDSPNGVRSAYAAGLRVIYVPDQVPFAEEVDYEELKQKVWRVVDNLADIIDLMEEVISE